MDSWYIIGIKNEAKYSPIIFFFFFSKRKYVIVSTIKICEILSVFIMWDFSGKKRIMGEKWKGVRTKHIYEQSFSILFQDAAKRKVVLGSILSYLSHVSFIGFCAPGMKSQNARIILAQRYNCNPELDRNSKNYYDWWI